MDMDELRNRKKRLKLTTAELAVLAELPVGTVSKVMTGETKNPTYVTIEKIERALAHEEMLVRVKAYIQALFSYIRSHEDEDIDQFKFEKEYRKEHELEYLPIPYALSAKNLGISSGNLAAYSDLRVNVETLHEIGEERQIELIDGHLIINEMPLVRHQILVRKIGKTIDKFIEENNGDCQVFDVGINVQLDEDDYTVVIPDIAVLCDKSRLNEYGIIGPPDWVIEITSPGTRHIDYRDKLHKYMRAGVREYWVVDLQKEKVTTYIEGEPMMAYVYDFDSDIPVYVFGGELKINVGG